MQTAWLFCFHLFHKYLKKNTIIALMLRGHRSTYLSLFDPPMAVVVNNDDTTDKRGRNEELIIKRNTLLIHRHYYYYKLKQVQYHIGLAALESEFFLTERTVVDIVQRHINLLRELKAVNPDRKYFEKKYPFLNWQ